MGPEDSTRDGPRVFPLEPSAFLIASGGASAHEAPHTEAAFRLALRLGATALATAARLDDRGEPVVGTPGAATRWRTIGRRRGTPDPGLPAEDLFALMPADVPVFISVSEDAAFARLSELATAHDRCRLTWCCSPSQQQLGSWRAANDEVRLVWVGRLGDLGRPPEAGFAALRRLRIDGVELHHSEWSGGKVALAHRFECRTFARDVEHRRIADAMLWMGMDGVIGTRVDRLVDAAAAL